MSVTYGSSRTTVGRALSTSGDPFQPQRELTTITPAAWTRPADWVAMPTIATGDRKIAILCAVSNDASNFMALSATGSAGYTVDWGDGSSPVNVASGVQSNYNYNYATVSSAVTDRGYKTVVITITPQGAGTLTGFNLNLRNPANTNTGTGDSAASSPILEVVACSANLTSVAMGSGTPNVRHSYCEQVTFIDTGTISSMASLFNNFQSLQSVVVGAAFGTGATDMSSMFGNCYRLAAAPMMVTTNCTNMNNMFQNCNNLISVPNYNTVAVTAMGSMFQECRSLRTAPDIDTRACTNFGNMFTSCSSLVNVPFYRLTAAGLTTVLGMFASCSSLKSVQLQQGTANNVAANTMFNGCSNLVNPPNLDYSRFNNVSNMYGGCPAIVRFPNRVFNFSNLADPSFGNSVFQNCSSLQEIDTIICNANFGQSCFLNCVNLRRIGTITGAILLNTTFSGCFRLTSLPALTGAAVGASNTFLNCHSLESIAINFAGAVVSAMTSFFSGCTSLQSVTITNATITGNISNLFTNCRALAFGPTLPSLAGVTNASFMFSGCWNLRTIPVYDFSSCTVISSMFNGCFSLQSVPALTTHPSSNTAAVSAFANCYSLESIDTLTFGSGTLTTGTMFSGCANLSSLRSVRLKTSFSIAFAKFAAAQLDQVYTDLPTVTGQTITVGTNWGTATDTPTIATAKGWTVSGT